MILEENQQLLDAIPQEVCEKIDGYQEEVWYQTGRAFQLKDQPLPDGHIPELVDLYVDGALYPCISIYQGKLLSVDKSFFADRDKATVIIAIEEDARYVQVHGELLVNSLGGCILPDVLVSPEAQLACLSQLLQ